MPVASQNFPKKSWAGLSLGTNPKRAYLEFMLTTFQYKTIKIMNSKLFIMKKDILCKYKSILPIFAHAGCFVNFWGGNCQNGTNGAASSTFHCILGVFLLIILSWSVLNK